MLIQGIVANPPSQSLGEGSQQNAILGQRGELIITELQGKYYTDCKRGRVFSASLAAAAAIPATAGNLTLVFGLWNKDPRFNCVPIRFNLGYVANTMVPGTIGYGYANAGYNVATGGVITAFTPLASQNGFLGGSPVSAGAACSAATLASGGTVARWSNMSASAPAAASTNFQSLYEEFDGSMIIPSGVIWYPMALAGTTATFLMSLIWADIPV